MTMPVIQSSMRLRRYLVAGYVLFIAYASLSPFSGWQDQGLQFFAVLEKPLQLKYSQFDLIANLVAYLPLGMLLYLILHNHARGMVKSVILATLGGLALSTSMEYAQMFLPSRTSSNLDLLANTTGSLTGALTAVVVAPQAWLELLIFWRQRLFHSGKGADFGLALMALWMFAQANPSLPMLGNVFISTTFPVSTISTAVSPFNLRESVATALNLLMLGELLLTLLYQRRHAVIGLLLVLCSVALTKFLAAALLLKSWALLLWLNGEAMFGIFIGVLLLAAASQLSRHWLLWCTAATALIYFLWAHILLDSNTSSSMSLYQWHYGHLLNYNGLSQAVLLSFPFLLLIYLWRIRKL